MRKIKRAFVECGCCGCFHLADFWGDCRDDKNRFTLDKIPAGSPIESLEEQGEKENGKD